jgi:hypothetical protein
MRGLRKGAASPLQANIYLHYALNLWVEAWRKRHARGHVIITRWADDFIVGFQYHADAVEFRGTARTVAPSLAGAAPRQNAPHLLRKIRIEAETGAERREARSFIFPGLHAHLR